MTDFDDWYAQQNPWIDPERDECLAELRKAYEAGAASKDKTMKLNDAIETILDFYLVQVEGDLVVAHATDILPTTVEVWAAWTALAKQTGRIPQQRIKTMTPLTPMQKHEQRLQMQQQGINAAASQDKTMTTPTPEEQAETWKTFEARINARSEAKADNAADIKAAGGLASDKTLRDEFAGRVITGISATEGDMQWMTQHGAKYAYQIADAMLEARKTTGEGKA
jgi:hypothetical protein